MFSLDLEVSFFLFFRLHYQRPRCCDVIRIAILFSIREDTSVLDTRSFFVKVLKLSHRETRLVCKRNILSLPDLFHPGIAGVRDSMVSWSYEYGHP